MGFLAGRRSVSEVRRRLLIVIKSGRMATACIDLRVLVCKLHWAKHRDPCRLPIRHSFRLRYGSTKETGGLEKGD